MILSSFTLKINVAMRSERPCTELDFRRQQYTGGPPYSRVIRFKTYRGYVKPRIIPNAIYNVIFL